MLGFPHGYYYKSHCKRHEHWKVINWDHQCNVSTPLIDWNSLVVDAGAVD